MNASVGIIVMLIGEYQHHWSANTHNWEVLKL